MVELKFETKNSVSKPVCLATLFYFLASRNRITDFSELDSLTLSTVLGWELDWLVTGNFTNYLKN